MTDIAEQAARVLRQATNDGANKTEDYAQALADAGLLREPERVVPTQDDITDALGPILFNNFNYPKLGESTAPLLNKITDAVLALLADQPTVNEVKSQAWDEAAQHLAGEYDDPNASQYLHDTNPHR